MAIINVTEFSDLAKDADNNLVMVGNLSRVVKSENVSFSVATEYALDQKTLFVRVIADADGYIAAGISPVATLDSTRIEADVAEYFGVNPIEGKAKSLSIFDGTST